MSSSFVVRYHGHIIALLLRILYRFHSSRTFLLYLFISFNHVYFPLPISFECLDHFALATLLYLAQLVSIPKLVTYFYNFGCFALGVAERCVDADVC